MANSGINYKDISFYVSEQYTLDDHPLSSTPPDVYKDYYTMYTEDPQIALIVDTIIGYLSPKFTYWYLEDEDTEEGQFVKKNLWGYLRPNINTVLMQAGKSLIYGMVPFEKVFEYSKEDKKVYLKKLVYREPASIYKIHYEDKEPYNVKSFEFFGRGQNGKQTKYTLEVDKLLIFTYNDDGGIVNGQSILRPLWKIYKLKKFLYKTLAIATAKNAAPIPIIKYKIPMSDEKKQIYKQIAKRMSATIDGYAAFPEKDIDLDFAGGNKTEFEFEKFIDLMNKEMNKAALLSFMSMGLEGKSGAYTSINAMKEMFYGKIWNLAETVANTVNDLIKYLVDINFPNPQAYPYISIRRVGTSMGENVDIRAIFMLSQYGFLEPDPVLEDFFRKTYGLPPKKPEEKTQKIEEQKKTEEEIE